MNFHKITILTSEFPPQPGGIGNHAYNLAKELEKNDYSVKVLCDRRSVEGEEEKDFDSSHNFQVIRILRKNFIIVSYFHRICEAFKLARRSGVIIASGRFQLWLGGLLSLFYKRKYIAIVHGSELLLPNPALHKLTNFSLTQFDKVIAVSNYTRTLVNSIELKNVEVIHNGFTLNCNAEEKKEIPTGPVLITVGNVNQRKGQQNVIAALPSLIEKYPNLQYRVVGIPTERDDFENLAKELKVENSVKFYGAVDEHQKCQLLRTSDIFIMLSETTSTGDVEGFGIAILEANSLGLPSIGATGCGIEEAIKKGYSGYLVDNKKPEKIVNSVDKILQNYTWFSNNAKEWSLQFSWERVIKQYILIIEKT